jgi:hypothetical protein
MFAEMNPGGIFICWDEATRCCRIFGGDAGLKLVICVCVCVCVCVYVYFLNTHTHTHAHVTMLGVAVHR